jgi:hypothetical protein
MDLTMFSQLRTAPSPDEIAAGLYPERTTAPSGSFVTAPPTGLDEQPRRQALVELRPQNPRPNTEILAGSIAGAGIWLAVATSAGLAPGAAFGYGVPTDLSVLPSPRTSSSAPDQGAMKRRQVHQRALTTTIGAQAREALAALAISKSQMAAILGIERPHLYAWLADKVDRPAKGDRLRTLLGLLAAAGIGSSAPLRGHLVTEPLEPGARPLLELLKGKDLAAPEIAAALASAARLTRAIDDAAARRIAQMRASGHKPPTDDEAQSTLDATLQGMEWDAG